MSQGVAIYKVGRPITGSPLESVCSCVVMNTLLSSDSPNTDAQRKSLFHGAAQSLYEFLVMAIIKIFKLPMGIVDLASRTSVLQRLDIILKATMEVSCVDTRSCNTMIREWEATAFSW